MSHPPEPVTINANPNREIFTTPEGQQYQLTNVANAAHRATLTGNPTKYTYLDKGILTPKIALPKTEFAETRLAQSAAASAIRNSRSYYFKYSNYPITISNNERIVEDDGRYMLEIIPSNSAAAGPTPSAIEVFITPFKSRPNGKSPDEIRTEIDNTTFEIKQRVYTTGKSERNPYTGNLITPGADPAAMKATR